MLKTLIFVTTGIRIQKLNYPLNHIKNPAKCGVKKKYQYRSLAIKTS